MWGRVHKHIAFKSHIPVLKFMPVLHSVFICFYNTHTDLEDRQRCVLLPPPPPSASDLISDSSPLCSLSQAHLPPCYSLNVPNALLPQGLCTCSPPPMEHSSPRGTFFPQDSCNSHPLASFRSLLTYLLLREISPNTILLNIASVQPHSTLYFISPHNTYHPLKYILLVYLLIVSLLPLNINSMRAELFV